MSWGAVPWWVYAVELEEHQARMLGAFQEEINAGITQSVPNYIVKLWRREDTDAD